MTTAEELLRDELDELEGRAAELEERIAKVRTALAALTGEPLPTARRPSSGNRSKLVLKILSDASGPKTRHELADALEALGSPTTADDVSASLTYLRRTGQARRSGDGGWEVVATE